MQICADCSASIDRPRRGPVAKRCKSCTAARSRDRVRKCLESGGLSSSAPCAGGCGKYLQGTPTSLPPGERMCRACRRDRNPRLSTCVHCGGPLSGSRKRTCSTMCVRAMQQQTGHAVARFQQQSVGPCSDCGETTERGCNQTGRFCGTCANRRRYLRNHKKRAKRNGIPEPSRRLTTAELGDRDGWRCHLCRRAVDRRLSGAHPKAPSVDHLVPVSDGGTDEPENLALAHWICNVRRGNRGIVQLALVG